MAMLAKAEASHDGLLRGQDKRDGSELRPSRRRIRLTVGVHSVLRQSLCRGDISLHDLGRMDNLLKVHN